MWPDAVRCAVWLGAWLDGVAATDDVLDAITADDVAHHVAGLPGGDPDEGAVPLALALGRLRSLGATGAGAALPTPGDPVGLAGPAAFNTEAIDVGEAVVVAGAEVGLVPHRVGRGVVWQAYAAHSRRQVPDPGEASTTLRRTLLQTLEALADLEVARWRPEVADELQSLRADRRLVLPEGLHRAALPLIAQGDRCWRIVELALVDDGGAVTAGEAEQRRAALVPLERAARRALVAACELPVGAP
ncbi:hypothetical protein KLP28_15915 [Nocardioidaceae bacterium]|nr:hypothetical protein KLP28_15915 [Nocardioidaceae bacterium]